VLSDFNASNFAGYLSNDEEFPQIDPTVPPFGQVMQVLMDKNSPYWKSSCDCCLIWTQPQTVSEHFNQLFTCQTGLPEKIIADVDEYCSVVLNAVKNHFSAVFLPIWVVPSNYRGLGLIDMTHRAGIRNAVMRMNLRLIDQLDQIPNVYALSTQRWVELAGANAFNEKLWYLAKIPFGNEVFKEAVRDIKAGLRGIHGAAKKIIILDLDDTLWGGTVGDVGWERLQLGGHDPIGEAYVDFQKALKSFKSRGVLLGLVSKNEEAVALEAINSHPEMVLRLDDFAGWKINWHDKAQNVAELIEELNLGVQSAIFIDDNPVERARVKDALPEVFVPDWPADKMLYRRALRSLSCFDTPTVSAEDAGRTQMYVTERRRSELKRSVGSYDQWLQKLQIAVTIEPLNDANLQRTCQLLNKTNQLNLTTRRLTAAELWAWSNESGRHVWTFRVSDKFGDSGLTGLISVEAENKRMRIVDFVLSCRVMGRKVEDIMLHTAIRHAHLTGAETVWAQYIPTPHNRPCFDLWKNSGFTYQENENTFLWQNPRDYPLPDLIRVEHERRGGSALQSNGDRNTLPPEFTTVHE
jgi:FkbH-like protein